MMYESGLTTTLESQNTTTLNSSPGGLLWKGSEQAMQSMQNAYSIFGQNAIIF